MLNDIHFFLKWRQNNLWAYNDDSLENYWRETEKTCQISNIVRRYFHLLVFWQKKICCVNLLNQPCFSFFRQVMMQWNWPLKSKTEMVFCYQNCSNLLWEKIVQAIGKNLEKFKADGREFGKVLRSLNNLSNQRKIRAIFETEYFFNLLHNGSQIWYILWNNYNDN